MGATKVPTTTIKVVPIATPAVAPVVATQIQTVADHPAVSLGASGNITLQTTAGVQVVRPGDWIVPDGTGHFKVIPQEFIMLQYLLAH